MQILFVVAYFYALLVLYTRTDFMGLQVLSESSYTMPPSWHPYANNHPLWGVGSALVILVVVSIRFATEKMEGGRRMYDETLERQDTEK